MSSQVWVRRSAAEPWVIDLPITPDRDGLWTSKRDPDHVAPLEEVTWVADDGIRYLRPEITLLYKAALHRPKDDRDLAVTWPLLDDGARDWLREAVAPALPGPPVAGADSGVEPRQCVGGRAASASTPTSRSRTWSVSARLRGAEGSHQVPEGVGTTRRGEVVADDPGQGVAGRGFHLVEVPPVPELRILCVTQVARPAALAVGDRLARPGDVRGRPLHEPLRAVVVGLAEGDVGELVAQQDAAAERVLGRCRG